MDYSLDKFLGDLESDRPWNDIRKDYLEASLDFNQLTTDEKAKVAQAINEYQYKHCPQEYKDNPQVHYEVRMKKAAKSKQNRET